MHPLLKRQLRKIGLDAESPPSPEAWHALVERVSTTYAQADQDRYMLERSLSKSSEEMRELYDELRTSSAAALEKKSDELTATLALVTAIVESVADAILVIGADESVLNFNRRFVELFDIDRDLEATLRNGVPQSILWMHCGPLIRDAATVRARVHAIMRDPDLIGTDEIELNDRRVLSRYTAPLKRSDGGVRARIWCFRDITEEKKLAHHRAVVAERMASVGQLVASVAHEINNPLAYIAGNVDLVSSMLREDVRIDPTSAQAEMTEALEDAAIGVERIKIIVRDLRTLSRADEDTREPTDIVNVVETSLQIANNELRHKARIIRDLKPTPLVSANAARLGQVFLNLLLNAAHAMVDGRASENTVTVSTGTLPNGHAFMRVRDTGSGIAPEHVERIFDPFFTTKPVGSGTGLGLSICRGIIDKLGGSIDMTTQVGVGTTFRVTLPPSNEGELRRLTSEVAPRQPPRRTILVVDDDAQIRRWFERVLPHHDVTTVPSVDAAEDALKTRWFDAILCDVMMPDRTGLDMHTFVKTHHPELLDHLIFMSGGTFTPALTEFFEHVPNVCLKKPFPKADLERAIEEVTRSAAPRGAHAG